jgi:hypothetical protein
MTTGADPQFFGESKIGAGRQVLAAMLQRSMSGRQRCASGAVPGSGEDLCVNRTGATGVADGLMRAPISLREVRTVSLWK